MPETETRESKRTWRGDASTVRPPTVGPQWRRATGQAPPRTGRRLRKLRAGIVCGAFFACLAAFVYVSCWLWPVHAARLVLIGAAYHDNLAVSQNVAGWNTLTRLAQFARSGDSLRLVGGPAQLGSQTDWSAGWDEGAERAVVVYFAVHGGADPDGAYLLPHDAAATLDPGNRLRLERLLDRLEQLPRQKHKLLVLDATGVAADWSLGLMENGFARRLAALEPRIVSIPNLVVISASGPDERSWAIPELSVTAFGKFFTDGLAGAADDNRDGRIDSWELYQFLGRTVGRWAWQNRGTPQTPLLLPLGEPGRRRAQAIELALVGPAHGAIPAEAPGPFEPTPALRQQWEQFAGLRRSVPPPVAHAPRLWRHYQALLLRYDQLVRTGAPDQAEPLLVRLEQLRREIDQAGRLEIGSLGNTLSMPVIAGRALGPSDAAQQALAKLWDAPPRDLGKTWTAVQTAFPDPRLARLELFDQLLRHVAEAPAANLDKGYTLVELLRDPVFPAPAELHFLTMLHRDLAQPIASEQSDLVGHALDVRRTAEQAVLGLPASGEPFSGRVRPRIAAIVTQADRARRLGEDLVFSTERADWETARELLQEARDRYRQAAQRANVVQRALAARNRAADALPHLAQWLARRQPMGEPQWQQADTALLLAAEQLASDLDRLSELLETSIDPKQSVDADAAIALDRLLEEQAAVVGRGLQFLEDEHRTVCQRLLTVTQPELWQEAEAALAVPGLEPALRFELLGHQRRLSRQLFLESSPAARVPETAFAESQARAKSRGARNARLALALIGRTWFDRCTGPGLEDRRQTSHRIATFAVEEKWYESLALAGMQIARRFRWMPGEIDRRVAAARSAEPAAAQALLAGADWLGRLLDPALAPALATDPTDSLRRLLLHQLLVFQAERTLQDRWYARDPAAPPYFRSVALAYLADADALGLGEPADRESAKLRLAIEQTKDLALHGPAQVSLTSEQDTTADFTLDAGAAALSGYVTLMVKAGERLELADPAPARRLVRQLGGDRLAETLRCTVKDPLAAAAERQPAPLPTVYPSQIVVEGLFRGQRLRSTTRVTVQPTPDLRMLRHPPPVGASIAVRAAPQVHDRYGAASGAIAIVLDCSGSMGPIGAEFTSDTKYAEATRALRQVLRQMPKGVVVSLWVFGQAVGPGKTVTDVERTIRRVADPAEWNPQDPAQLDDLMSRIEYPALEPWNTSPVLRAMLAAREDLRNLPGFKTLLVLTDGMDNRFLEDKEANPQGHDIPTTLRHTFDGSGIVVNMIGFKVAASEADIAQAQFGAVEQLTPPGHWYSVADASRLVDVMDGALKQKLRYRLETGVNAVAPQTRAEGYDASRQGDNNQWLPGGVPAGAYQLVVHADRRIAKPIVVDNGESLLIDLAPVGERLELLRGVYSLEDLPQRPAFEKNGWRLALLQNQATATGGVEMLVTLEKLRTPAETTLAQIRPRYVWWELAPTEPTETPFRVEWHRQFGYPAPAWAIHAPSWPARPQSPTPLPLRLQAWWEPDRDPFPAAVVTKGNDFKTPAELADRTLRVGDAVVTLESVRFEEHWVSTNPDGLQQRPCLVIRAACPGSDGIWVQLEGIAPVGEEHRYYRQSGRYAGLFWPITADQAQRALSSVKVYSVATFKRQAEERGYTLDLGGLMPKPNDVRPTAVEP